MADGRGHNPRRQAEEAGWLGFRVQGLGEPAFVGWFLVPPGRDHPEDDDANGAWGKLFGRNPPSFPSEERLLVQ